MVLQAVTFDFWSTLVDGAITPERTIERAARLHAAHRRRRPRLHARGGPRRASIAPSRGSTEAARENFIDVGPPGRWAILADELGIPDGLIAYELVEHAYEDITLEPLPDAMPHVQVAVEAMRDAGYRLAVICNTGMAGGRVLREVLKRHGLFDYFEVTVFSNEFGLAKPHPGIFEHTLAELGGIAPSEALHVGDLEELDVEGARRAGVHSARYVPETDGQIADRRRHRRHRLARVCAAQVAELRAKPRTSQGLKLRRAHHKVLSAPGLSLPLVPAVTVADPLENVRAWWDEDAEIDPEAYEPADVEPSPAAPEPPPSSADPGFRPPARAQRVLAARRPVARQTHRRRRQAQRHARRRADRSRQPVRRDRLLLVTPGAPASSRSWASRRTSARAACPTRSATRTATTSTWCCWPRTSRATTT